MTVLRLLAFLLVACAAAVAAGPVRDERAAAAAVTTETGARAKCVGEERKAKSGSSVDTTARLAALRAEMRRRGIQAYYVPSGDDHQSEYVAEHDKRREFLSGFSGSAGDAVVTLDAAALWTDSRYYLQAERQLDCNWLLMRSGLPGVPGLLPWISANLPSGSNVSTDPKVVPYSTWNTWNTTLASSGINMVLLEENLVDPIWEENGRPPYPDVPLSVLDIKFAGESWESKLERLRAELRAKGADATVVTALDEIAWALNLRGGDVPFTPVFRAYLVVTLDRAALYLPEEKIPQAEAHLNASTQAVKIKTYNSIWEDLPEIGKSAKKVFLPSQYSYALGVSMLVYSALSAKEVTFGTSPLLLMKDRKNKVEADGMRWAHVKDAIALCQLLYELEKGIAAGEYWDELKVEDRLAKLRSLQKDNEGPSFETIAAFADNAALPHYTVTLETNKVIDNSSVFMLDSGGQYLDGTTDVTRTIHLGTPSPKQKEVYTNILRGCIDIVSTTFPEGQTLNTLEILIRAPLYSMGLNYGHGSTHGIGSFLGVHEAFDTTYHAYFFGSQEPGYYQDNEFGMRLENIVTVVPTNMSFEGKSFLKFEAVTLVPYDRNLIDINVLSDKELVWLNDYHTRIRSEVGKEMLEQGLTDVYQWLLNQTAPLSK
ncbi:hypothetical protein R5R35_008195 [Gryllus longicercus]|uniref:Uncharacterized protein n=1 Tax=Gryllus longicercus TaxID=2509291 RepID=A0AAN9VTH9_9ORTH